MPSSVQSDPMFPKSLFDWGNAGRYSVCRGSDRSTGWQKPPLRTRLIIQFEQLAEKLTAGLIDPELAIILVGGPGNGKTHAAHYFLRKIMGDEYPSADQFGAETSEFEVHGCGRLQQVRFVEDASAGENNDSVYKKFVEDIEHYVLEKREGTLFLCCVNRGILATVLARIANGSLAASERAYKFIARLSSVVSPDATPVALWPFADQNNVFLHPMDEESLLETFGGVPPVAIQVVEEICSANCEGCSSCPNASLCPMLINIKALQDSLHRDDMLKILRYFEIVASKRLSFRDLFSVVSLIIAGAPEDYVYNGKMIKPCDWVARHVEMTDSNKLEDRLVGYFELEAALYQNRLFANWADFKKVDRQLQKNIRDSGSEAIKKTLPLFKALAVKVRRSTSIAGQNHLARCGRLLDPSLQDCAQLEDLQPEVAAEIKNIEEAFCKSLTLGVKTFKTAGCRVPNAIEDRFLDECVKIEQDKSILDMPVSSADYALSQTVLSALRIVLSRFAKRSIGVAKSFVYCGGRLADFRALLAGDTSIQNYPAKRRKICATIQNYLFPDGEFRHSMLATFGQTEPDAENAVFLKNSSTPDFELVRTDQSANSVRNLLFVRAAVLGIVVKVNFDLYSTLIDLQSGLSAASLPTRIADIFDGIKARIQGRLCHRWNAVTSLAFMDRNGGTHSIRWSEDEGFFEEEA